MGINWKSAMPLLSTLAALVIIVHSAEEDRQSEYTRDLRPRIVDPGIHSYEQPWRVVDSEPVLIKSIQTNTWNNNSTEESLKHRRARRKRKRRPQIAVTDSLSPQETNNYPEDPLRSSFGVDLIDTDHSAEKHKRRRKKLKSKSAPWAEVPLQRPFRRRRKRPSLKTLPELSDLNGFQNEESASAIIGSIEHKEIPNINQDDESSLYKTKIENVNDGELLGLITAEPENTEKGESKDELQLFTQENDTHTMQHRGPFLQEDESLSEFSLEVMHHIAEPRNNNKNEHIRRRLKDKSIGAVNEYGKEQIHGPVDPITLKDILKRSNGTSLSEILQLHNLSLADLLHGKENAISILKGSDESAQRIPVNITNNVALSDVGIDPSQQLLANGNEENVLFHLETKYVTVPVEEFTTTTDSILDNQNVKDYKKDDTTRTAVKQENTTNKIISIRRFPVSVRRKLRMKPMINSTRKSPLSRDLIALNSRKYINQRQNISKAIEWRNVIPAIINISSTDNDIDKETEISTARIATDEHITIQIDVDERNQSELFKDDNNKRFVIDEGSNMMFSTTSTKPDTTSEIPVLVNETKSFMSTVKPVANTPGLQRPIFNNRMKKKRRRQKNSTTDSPTNNIITYPLRKESISFSTEIIMTSQDLKQKQVDEDFVTILEDFMTTQNPSNLKGTFKSNKQLSIPSITLKPLTTTYRTDEKHSKIEIDEIFKDIQTSARLSEILKERNMTLRELVEHRERGSSHVHLADIFHNASKEPNPSEPFLSKSAIEPISKETYPLRAILEANAHDATIKPIINDPSILETSYLNIPVVMDFGNNVNENAENMGIMSLFNNFTKNVHQHNNSEKYSGVSLYGTDTIATNTTQLNKAMPTVRQNRILTDSTNQDDVVSWNEIFSLMRKNYKNESKDIFQSIQEEPSLSDTLSKINIQDVDGDGLIVFEDLQHLNSFDSNIPPDSNERLDVNSLGGTDTENGSFEKIPSQTKSITVVTASIAGLAMVLFLLVYAVFKWKQHKVVPNKEHSFCNERIPTPVFENRKGHKNNSSTRSISPMLSTSNIYTLNTLDSRNGKDSPEYMWDTLRKPFQ